MDNNLCDVKQHVKEEAFVLNASDQVQPKAEAMCMSLLFVCLSVCLGGIVV